MESLPRDDPDSADDPGRIWVHALSVGEVLSAEPLIKALERRHGVRNLIFTASTQTGFDVAERVIAKHVRAVRYFPYDAILSVNRAMEVIKPRQVVVVETDIWPNFLHRLKMCKIPVYLVNARLSDRSFRGYKRLGVFMAPLLSGFSRICVQTDSDWMRFRDLGVPEKKLATVGNIKFDQTVSDVCTDDLNRLSKKLNLSADLPIWVAGSTHEGEEEILSNACQALLASGMDPVLIVAPRDPGRALDVIKIFNRSGFDARTMAQMETLPGPARVVVVDRIGILRDVYALADVAFVGGSLVKAGGHNPLEPASFSRPVIFGPHTDDFRWICRMLVDAGGAIRVHDADQLADTIRRLILNREENKRIGRCAHTVFTENQGAVARTLAAME